MPLGNTPHFSKLQPHMALGKLCYPWWIRDGEVFAGTMEHKNSPMIIDCVTSLLHTRARELTKDLDEVRMYCNISRTLKIDSNQSEKTEVIMQRSSSNF